MRWFRPRLELCFECGAYVDDLQDHENWHDRQRELILVVSDQVESIRETAAARYGFKL